MDSVGSRTGWCATLAFAATTALGGPLPIFDAHLHYNAEAVGAHPVPEVLELLARSDVVGVLVTSVPNDGTRALLAAARPGLRVVAFLRPYRTDADRAVWFRDADTLSLIEVELGRAAYRGIGEFHLYGDAAGGEVVRRVVALAVARGLFLHAHCDEAALERIFAHDPNVRVIWAHTGFDTPPERIERWLERFPALWGELSYRHDVMESGQLAPAWRRLFLRHPDRFLVGSDTWVNERWQRYGEIVDSYRTWLSELPTEVAEAIAWKNAERLFAR